jgi:hypothetical protein
MIVLLKQIDFKQNILKYANKVYGNSSFLFTLFEKKVGPPLAVGIERCVLVINIHYVSQYLLPAPL